MQIQIRVCEIDQRVGLETKPYTITQGDNTVTVDLCDEHGAWLDELITKAIALRPASPFLALAEQPRAPAAASRPAAKKVGTAPAVSRGRKSGVQVRTLAEIEAEKQQR